MERQEKNAQNKAVKATHTTVKQVFDRLHPGNSNIDRLIVGGFISRIWYRRNPEVAPLKVEQQEGDDVFRVCAYPVSFTNTIKKVITTFLARREQAKQKETEKEQQGETLQETKGMVVPAPDESVAVVLTEEPKKRKRIVRTVAVKQVEAVTSSDRCLKGKKQVS